MGLASGQPKYVNAPRQDAPACQRKTSPKRQRLPLHPHAPTTPLSLLVLLLLLFLFLFLVLVLVLVLVAPLTSTTSQPRGESFDCYQSPDALYYPAVIALFAYLSLALGISFLCSILEAALLSMTPSFVRQREQAGSKSGVILGRLKRDIDRPLAAILSLNTVAHTVGAAGVGAQAVAVFGEAYFGVISAVLTLLILVASEIIPKTLGAQHWRALSVFTAYACRAIIVATYPLVWLSKQVTTLLQSKESLEKSVSRDELVALAQIGQSEGVLEASETRMIRSLVRFRDIRVESIMTPRTVLGAIPESATCQDAISQRHLKRFTRIPVFSDTKDNIIGYVLKSDLLQQIADGRPDTTAGEIARPIRIVSELDTLSKLFDELIRHKEQLAVVVDEYGGTSGLVTMEDVIETLLGLEIVDESDREVDMRELARQRWQERARKSGLIGEEPSEPPPAQ